MNRIALWLDNPILVKHWRSRLRRSQMLPSIAIVMIIALSIVLLGYQYDGLHGGETFGGLMTFQIVLLGIMGASQISSSVGKARDSGILDFHRVSPMSPLSVTMGFFFGAPIREYLMFAVTLPFSLLCVFMGRPSIQGFFQLMVPMVLAMWILHALALLNGLAGKKGKAGTGGVIAVIMFLIFGASSLVFGFARASIAIDETPTLGFYWFQLPWLVILALDLFPVIGFFLIGSTRKMASERAHLLSKPQAIACLSTLAVLMVGGLWNIGFDGYWTIISIYVLVVGGIIMASTITPSRDEFAKGIRKAAKEGRKYPSAWSDRGLNRIAVFCLCAVVLVAPTVVWYVIENNAALRTFQAPLNYSLPIAIGVLVVAYFGLALQYFQLRFARRGTVFFAMFLFAAWLLPLVCGAISLASTARQSTPNAPPDVWSPALASLSPIFGITISSGVGDISGHQTARAAALVPSLVFALLFNNLVTTTRRRIEKEIHPEPASDFPAKPEVVEPVMLS